MPKIYLVALIALVTSEWTKSSLLIENEKENCLKGIFNIDEDVTFATSTTFQNDDFIFEISNPKLIRNYKGGEQLSSKNDRNYNYVIIDGDYVDFKNTISNLLKENNLKVNGKYLIKMKNNLEEFEMRLFFGLLWKYEVYNVVIETDHQFYTWYPYERWGEMTVRRTNLTQGFANKIPKKLNCTLRIDWTSSSTVVKNAHNETDPGIFILYVNEIAKRMGVSPQYSKTGAGFLNRYRANHSFEFDKAMEENNVTVAVGSYTYFFGVINLTYTRQSSYLAPLEQLLILPPRHTKPRWREFFKFDTWTAIFITTVMLGCGLLISLFLKVPPLQSFLLSFQIYIQLMISLKPKTFSSKIFVWCMLVSSMLLNSFYLSILSGVFTRPNYEAKVTTFDDFAKSDIVFECPESYCSTYLSGYDSTTRSMLEKKIIRTNRKSLDDIFYFLARPDHAFFTTRLHLEYIKNKENVGKIHVLSSLRTKIH
jgi:hypothetical protein